VVVSGAVPVSSNLLSAETMPPPRWRKIAVNEVSRPLQGWSLESSSGLRADLTSSGSIRRLHCGAVTLSLFVGNELEDGASNVYLRRRGVAPAATPLLGPSSPTRFDGNGQSNAWVGGGEWQGIRYRISLVLSESATAWFWHVLLENRNAGREDLDLTYVQDVALASYGAVRLNEFYVSQYLDHSPLLHSGVGRLVATRQNQAVDGRHPWTLIGSLRSGASFATDALQFHGLASRQRAALPGLAGDLPGRRLQHEHALVVIRDATIALAPGARIDSGFFGGYWEHHPEATSDADAQRADELLQLAEAEPKGHATSDAQSGPSRRSLFSSAPLLRCDRLDRPALEALFPAPWRHEETDDQGRLLSFFHGSDRHVVLQEKEWTTLRPHGHVLRTGRHLTPDESALTSTAWMAGVFHSMTTQGHVSINRLLSTVHSYLGLFRSHGQRVFVEIGGAWQLLDVPSAFEMSPTCCRWIYRHEGGEIHVCSEAHSDPHAVTVSVDIVDGPASRILVSHHVALNGDDGSTQGAVAWRAEGRDIILTAIPDSDVGRRFPDGYFRLSSLDGTSVQQVGGDELLFEDGTSRNEPFVCVVTAPATTFGFRIRGHLVAEGEDQALKTTDHEDLIPQLSLEADEKCPKAEHVGRLGNIATWFTHNAFVHYLSPRGLEQYSGGGWGTRDVCQGPVELLLALDRVAPIRDLLLRVMGTQNADGDWPQWFMFFERERNIRPGDSHGDIVLWPLLALGQYLIASGDGEFLDEPVAFFQDGERGTVWDHVQRAMRVIGQRVIAGTRLAAYGHGDWNDSLQPADPVMRERLCSAWTVTLHVQMLTTLAEGLRAVGRKEEAATLNAQVDGVRADFQRHLVVDGVLTGYALFQDDDAPRLLLHPRDESTGVRYSALAMVHAILEDLLTPEQARTHLRLLESELSGPDGLRLFDRPMRYHGGPQRLFQRAETATYFGREIGLMYMHAHLRYAQALARVGDAERFFHALCQATPIGIRSIVPGATLRQSNCYYSSSDAAFEDRDQASAEYDRVRNGNVSFDGGWRVYSSGAGIALGLIVRRFLGLSIECNSLSLDPVMPPSLDGLQVQTSLLGRPVTVVYSVRGKGVGVNGVLLNKRALAFTTGANPYRRGAAILDRGTVAGLLESQGNVLEIDVG
jgi:cellobiose phosphorylase